MGKSTINMRTALFLAAVCAQTYTQFHNRDGTFIMPKGYHLVGSLKHLLSIFKGMVRLCHCLG